MIKKYLHVIRSVAVILIQLNWLCHQNFQKDVYVNNKLTCHSYFSQAPQTTHIPAGSTYAPGMNVLADSHAGKRLQAQGHPLKSFTVPAPPPISAPGTPQPKHIGK